MKIMIVDGIPSGHPYEDYSNRITDAVMTNSDHQIDYFRMRDMNIRHCTGCWSCWWKTPGLCAIKDDQELISSRIPHMDRVIYVTPIIAGYESSLIKTCKDRSIVTAHPYITIREGEQHHYERYEQGPDVAVLALTDEDTTAEDLDLMRDTYRRVALNMGNGSITIFDANTEKGGISHVLNHI